MKLRQRRFSGLPPIDIEAEGKKYEEYKKKALPEMVQWMKTRPATVQHDEVMKLLSHYDRSFSSLPLYVVNFCRAVLLPELKEKGLLEKVPLKTVAILYSINLQGSDRTVVSAEEVVSTEKGEKAVLQFSVKAISYDMLILSTCEVSNYLDPINAKPYWTKHERLIGEEQQAGDGESSWMIRA